MRIHDIYSDIVFHAQLMTRCIDIPALDYHCAISNVLQFAD